jgi:hypothetical protein
MYAVNVADTTRLSDAERTFLLAPVLQPRQVEKAEMGRIDGLCVVLQCDDERARAIIQLLRKKYPKHILRFYHKKIVAWKRI